MAPGADEIQVTAHGSTTALQTATFTPTGGSIYTTYFLDPSSTNPAFSIFNTDDPVAVGGVLPPISWKP